MSQEFLDHLRVFARGKKERGGGMPKTMDGQTLNPRFLADTPEDPQEVPGAQKGRPDQSLANQALK